MLEILSPYYIIIIPVLVGGIVQVTKFIAFSLKHGWDWRYAMTHGHMPSAHTGFIISLLTSVGYYDGIHTGAFAVAMGLAIIVIDDAARLRMYMGDQGRYLNMLIRELKVDESQFPRLKERMGHRVSEVIIGGIYGFFLTLLFAKLLS
ncbi:MAG: Phosphatidic acid phosphatase-related protein [uncultured bacterium]|nr:MAG: Phosphatidic acid phosphatase-related protein [uncultured bacterium]HCU70502.1 acid phosphatase [Candidatus Moranbacteria bacterium]